MRDLCNILSYFLSVEIHFYVSYAVRETARYNVFEFQCESHVIDK